MADENESEQSGQRGDQESHAPGYGVRQPCSGRHAEQRGDGHPRDHDRDGLHFTARFREFPRNDSAHAEIGPVGQPRNEPCREQSPEIGRDRRHQVSRCDDRRQKQQDPFQREPADEQQRRRSAAYAESVCRNQMSGLRNGYVETGGDIAENAHHQKFGDSQCESAERQCDKTPVHFTIR